VVDLVVHSRRDLVGFAQCAKVDSAFFIFQYCKINDFVSDISSINNFSPPLNCLMIAHYITIDSIRVYDNKSHFSFGLKLGSKKINRNRP